MTSEIEVIKFRNQNMAVLLSISLIKVCKWMKIWDKKLIISSYLGYVSNILTLSFIICVGKRSGGFKISSQYFTKMLSIPRFRSYRPFPTNFHHILFTTKFFLCSFLRFTSCSSMSGLVMNWEARHGKSLLSCRVGAGIKKALNVASSFS